MHSNCKVVLSVWSRNWWKWSFFSREMLIIIVNRETFYANIWHRLAGIQTNNKIFRFQVWFNSSVWLQPEVGEPPGQYKSSARGHRSFIHHTEEKEKLFCFPSSIPPGLLLTAVLQRAAGQSGPKRRAPLMAFINAALRTRRAPAHRARRSRTAAQLAGVKHGSVIWAALALILSESSAALHRVRLPAGRICLCISSADHFPANQRSLGERLRRRNYSLPDSDLG